jgi:hypothetical protein
LVALIALIATSVAGAGAAPPVDSYALAGKLAQRT